MTAVATLRGSWSATNSNGRSALTLRPAGYRTGRWLVKAGTGRLGNLHSSKDCRSAPKFQASSRVGGVNFRRTSAAGVRSHWESGVDEPVYFTQQLGCKMRKRLDAAVWAKSNGKCWYCGCAVTIGAANVPGRMCIDHLHSQAMGGGDDLSNLVPACRSCNSGKGKRDVETFRWTAYRKKYGIPNFSREQREWLAAQGVEFVELPNTLFWFEREGMQP